MAKTEATSTITVIARQKSRWRCGMEFTAEPREAEVTEAQARAIADDPLLAIVPAREKDKKDKS
jgi:hypothetical protein